MRHNDTEEYDINQQKKSVSEEKMLVNEGIWLVYQLFSFIIFITVPVFADTLFIQPNL